MAFNVRALVVVSLGLLASGVAVEGARHETHRRFDTARARLAEQCTAFHQEAGDVEDPCDVQPSPTAVMPLVNEAKSDLQGARAAIAAHDKAAASRSLDDALSRAEKAERAGTLMGFVAAARIVDAVLTVVAENRSELGDEASRQLVDRAHLYGPERALEALRLYRLSALATIPDGQKIRAPGEAIAAEMMQQNELALEDMRRALVAKDQARCERAADRETFPVAGGAKLDHEACRLLSEISRVASRLEEARAKAKEASVRT